MGGKLWEEVQKRHHHLQGLRQNDPGYKPSYNNRHNSGGNNFNQMPSNGYQTNGYHSTGGSNGYRGSNSYHATGGSNGYNNSGGSNGYHTTGNGYQNQQWHSHTVDPNMTANGYGYQGNGSMNYSRSAFIPQ